MRLGQAFGFPRVTVWALRAQRVIHVAHVNQLARLVAIAPVVLRRVALPIDHDVVLMRDRGGKVETAPAFNYQLGTSHRVLLHYLPFLIGELPGLV